MSYVMRKFNFYSLKMNGSWQKVSRWYMFTNML